MAGLGEGCFGLMVDCHCGVEGRASLPAIGSSVWLARSDMTDADSATEVLCEWKPDYVHNQFRVFYAICGSYSSNVEATRRALALVV